MPCLALAVSWGWATITIPCPGNPSNTIRGLAATAPASPKTSCAARRNIAARATGNGATPPATATGAGDDYCGVVPTCPALQAIPAAHGRRRGAPSHQRQLVIPPALL